MSSLIVEVCEIKEIKKHPDAETTNLEIVVVKGWECIVKKGQYKQGDSVIFIPPDALLPDPLIEKLGVRNYLAGKEKNRVKCARLRGVVSYGLIVDNWAPWNLGSDVGEILGITKYEPPVRATAGDAAPEDPFFIAYTDIENISNFPDVFEKGETVIVTEKIDGCFREDQKVMLANGEQISISEIKKGDMVLSYDEKNKEFLPKKVLNVLSENKNKKWIKLYFGDGRDIVCTEDHLFLTLNRGWIKAVDVKEEDEFVDI